MWDGTFLLARIINPTDEDAEAYQMFILAVVRGSKILQCPITPKIHIMLRHVQLQIKNIPGCQESSFGTQAWCGRAPCTSGRWQFVGDKGFRGKWFAYFKYSLQLEVRAKAHSLLKDNCEKVIYTLLITE